jgi:hypothetical protein
VPNKASGRQEEVGVGKTFSNPGGGRTCCRVGKDGAAEAHAGLERRNPGLKLLLCRAVLARRHGRTGAATKAPVSSYRGNA